MPLKGVANEFIFINFLSMISTPKRYTHFQWTFSTLGCPELGLDAICALARKFEISSIELRATNGRVDLPNLFRERFAKPTSLVRYLEDQGVTICCLDSSLKLVGNDEAGRKEFVEFLPWADAIGTPFLRVFDGGTVSEGLNDEAFGKARETLHWWTEEKFRGGWQADVAIETHDALVGSQSIDRILESYPKLKVIWDTHHTWKKSGQAAVTSWNHLKSNVCNVHIKDSISAPSAHHPFTYVNLGEGEFPLDDTLQLLHDHGYSGPVSIEWEKMWHPYLSDIKVALQTGKDLGWF